MLSWKLPSFSAGNTTSISGCVSPLPVWSCLVNYTTLAHLLKWYLVSKLKHPNPKENANNLSETVHPNPVRSRKQTNPRKKTKSTEKNKPTGKKNPVIQEKTKSTDWYPPIQQNISYFFPPSTSATQSWFPRAQPAAATCQQQIIKNATRM